MAITPADVRALSLVGKFDIYSDPQIQNRINRAELRINEAAWDREVVGRADEGRALVAAHLICCDASSGSGPGGQVTSQKAKGIAQSYAALGGVFSDSMYAKTEWGRQYLELRCQLPNTPLTLNTQFGHLAVP